ncbi:MAG TPA: sugar ABC transporter permease [Kofleriaceae bacterium]
MSLVVRQLRDFCGAAVLALVIALCGFVAARNRDLEQRQLALADRAAHAALHAEQVPDSHAVLVDPAQPSAKHAFLRRRRVVDDGTARELTAGTRDDKLFYDAAARADRDGPFTDLLADGTGRAIAVVPRGVERGSGYAIALTDPAAPAPAPWLVLIGVLGLGAAFAAAGGLAGPTAARAGTFFGVGALAVPCLLWGSPFAATAILLLAAALAFAQHRRLTDRLAAGARLHRTALAFLAPAGISMAVLVLAPFAIGLVLGFYDHHHGTWTFVGLKNFGEILSGGGRPLDDPLNFWFILGVTVLWTVANVLLHVTLGVLLALVLSRRWLRGRGVFRMLFILPWAVPNYITALIWKGMFTGEYGAVNSLLHSVGLGHVSWFGSWSAAFTANVVTNTWLGFPFMMIVALGALESIPKELYEAAAVDGASSWQCFWHITLPHLRPALGPAIALGSIWTFNMFNVIYLVSAGQPGGSTNILVTDAYRWAFQRGERYGMAAAYATIIFGILLLWTVFGSRIGRRKEAI